MMYRVEDKYVCRKEDMLLLQMRINSILHLDSNRTGKEGYTITSLYFDDVFDSCLRDNEDGAAQRWKYRIRIYNHSFQNIKLEIKIKKYNRILKRSRSITIAQMKRLICGECIEDDLPAMDNPITLFNLAIREKGLRPVVIVEYDREAYVYEGGNVRITFDRNVRMSNWIERFGDTDLYMEPIKGEEHVLEVKYDEFLPDFIAQLLELGNMNQCAFSKYRSCRSLE